MPEPPAAAQGHPSALAVSQAVLEKFRSLPKTGKPQPHEHTVLAGIVAYTSSAGNSSNSSDTTSNAQQLPQPIQCAPGQQALHVIALGTGTKSMGASKRSAAGDVLHDSHAEAVARRSFVAWVHGQLQLAAQQLQQTPNSQLQPDAPQQPLVQSSPAQGQSPAAAATSKPAEAAAAAHQLSAFRFCPESGKFALLPGVRFAMYVSQPPCGDASIFRLTATTQGGCSRRQRAEDAAGAAAAEATPAEQQAVGRTGAKVLRPSGVTDVAAAAAAVAAVAGAAAAAAVADAPDVVSSQLGSSCSCLASPKSKDAQQQAAQNPPAAAQQVQEQRQEQQQEQQQVHQLHQQVQSQEQQQQQVQQGQPQPLQQQVLMYSRVPTAQDVETGAQQLGVLRRKPGKGEPTLSLSCSDKIARWACLGLQGSLLTALLQGPLYLSLLVVSVPGAGVSGVDAGQQQQQEGEQAAHSAAAAVFAAAEAAGRRAFGDRLAGCAELLQEPFRLVVPHVVAVGPADAALGLQSGGARTTASGVSINWSCQCPLLAALGSQRSGRCAGGNGRQEVTGSLGRKAGASCKSPSAKTRSRLCQAVFFEQWQQLMALTSSSSSVMQQPSHPIAAAEAPQAGDSSSTQMSCEEAKQQFAAQYESSWRLLKSKHALFAEWLTKPS